METVQFILTILLWVMCPLLVLLVLVQGGTGDVASSFGGGGQLDSSLGVGASKKMAKLTGALSVIFLIAVLIISIPVEKTVNSYGLDPLAPVAPAAVEPAIQPAPEAAAPAITVEPAPATDAEVATDAEATVTVEAETAAPEAEAAAPEAATTETE